MDNSLGSAYHNTPSPFKGLISEYLNKRKSRQDEERRANEDYERRMADQAMAHQLATDRIYHQGNIEFALQDQKARHASDLSAQESRQRRGEQRSAVKTLREAGGGQPVRSMTIPGGSVTFGHEEETKKRRRARISAPQQEASSFTPTPTGPLSPQFSAAGSGHDAQSSEPRVSRTGL